jgi:hypothetical protein
MEAVIGYTTQDWIGSLVALTTYATIPLRIWLGFMLLFSSGLEKRSTEI